MIGREHLLRTDRPEIALLVHMDGQGGAAQKLATWRSVKAARPGGHAAGLEELLRRGPPDVQPGAHDGASPTAGDDLLPVSQVHVDTRAQWSLTCSGSASSRT